MKKIKFSVIYKITSKKDLKIYVGSAIDFDQRRRDHLCRLKNNTHHNNHLQNAWNLYGPSNFEIEILEEVPLMPNETRLSFKERLIEREQYYLDTLLFASENDRRFFEMGYNKDRNASSPLGRKLSDAIRKKLSDVHKGLKQSDATKLKKSLLFSGSKNPFFGKTHTEEIRKKLSDANIGKKLSEEHKSIISKFHSKQILQYKKKIVFLKEWDKLSSINKELGIKKVKRVCDGKCKTAGGFYWEYSENGIKQFEIKKEFLNKWNSIKDAAKEINIENPISAAVSISKACRCDGGFSYGFYWKFAK